MYCRLYMHTDMSREDVVGVLEKRFGRAKKRGISDYGFGRFDIMIRNNDEFHPDRLRMYPDGFLYYELTAEADVYEDIIPTMDAISKVLWGAGIPTVVSCDEEEELNRYIMGL
ncbi:hypothetical protein [Ruminococcus albus]|uniref:Uncharacterized protein n=1 Tax=Ruminococcus albus TaxID=1264 RepID=A0A1H7PZJ8_RUMAL|nr:hypothetical protein [Ruminococcus albus]SEL40467.1 hypothetical protein SAMN05216469_12621 [Ruminococcus albus]